MKMIFSVILGLIAMTALYAANTEVARLTVKGDGGAESSYITLRVDPTVSAAETGAFFLNTALDGNVNLYVDYQGGQYSSFKDASIMNLPIAFISNRRDSHYIISFNVPTSTAGLTLTDLVENQTVNIANGDTYEFDVNAGNTPGYAAGSNIVIADRFVINYHAADYTVTTNAYGWSTFAVNADVEWLASESPELKAYSGLVSADASALDLYEIAVADAVPAGEGVIFHGAANTTYNLYNAASATPIASNDLIGCTADKDVTAESNVFVLSGNAFQEYTGSYIPAGKAYIHVNTGSAAPAQRMAIRIHPVATGVEAVAAEAKAEKLVRDGQLLILRDGKTYNVQGQLVK